MASDLLGISISGLKYSQTALSTTGHNIANAGTAGYSRQTVSGATNPATFTGAGFIGNGVHVDAIARVANDFVTEQIRSDSSLFQGLDAFNSYTGQLNGLLADSATGLTGALGSFFASVQNSANDPTSIPARQLVVSEADNLADRFNTLHSHFEAIEASVNGSIDTVIAQVNALSSSLGAINAKIAEASGKGMANDLLDKRDETLRQLSELINIRTLEQGDGQVNVVVGKGQSLVLGKEARELGVVTSASDATTTEVVVKGNPPQTVTDSIAGGQLGGLLKFRDGPLNSAFLELGRIAVVMGAEFNRVHELGMTLNNEFGGAFFNDVNDPVVARHRITGHSNNSDLNDRQMALNIVEPAAVKASNYELRVSQGEDGLVYTVTRLSDGASVVPSVDEVPGSVMFDGLELDISGGTFRDGDRFLMKPVADGAQHFGAVISDPNAIAYAGPVAVEASSGNIGNGKISGGEWLHSDPDAFDDMPLVVEFTADNQYRLVSYANPNEPEIVSGPHSFDPGLSNSLFPALPDEAGYRGIQAVISGRPQAGDRFTIDFNENGAGDNRNGLALVNLQSSATIGGSASFAQGYGALVEKVGIDTSSSKISKEAAEQALKQSTELRESVSGVNLDEEAANLIRFEQMFSANAQVISVARELFDRLISSF